MVVFKAWERSWAKTFHIPCKRWFGKWVCTVHCTLHRYTHIAHLFWLVQASYDMIRGLFVWILLSVKIRFFYTIRPSINYYDYNNNKPLIPFPVLILSCKCVCNTGWNERVTRRVRVNSIAESFAHAQLNVSSLFYSSHAMCLCSQGIYQMCECELMQKSTTVAVRVCVCICACWIMLQFNILCCCCCFYYYTAYCYSRVCAYSTYVLALAATEWIVIQNEIQNIL